MLYFCQQQKENLQLLLVKQGVKICLLFQALMLFAGDTLPMPGYPVQTLQTLQLWEHPLNLEAFKNVKSLKVFRSNHLFLFFFFVQAYFAVVGCDVQCGCALDCPVLGGGFLHELLCINKPVTTVKKNAGFCCKSASSSSYSSRILPPNHHKSLLLPHCCVV